jgi:cyanate permease
MAGMVHDATGSYAIAWWISIGVSLMTIVGIWMAAPGKVRAVAGRIGRIRQAD